MKLVLVIALFFFISCKQQHHSKAITANEITSFETDEYELIKSNQNKGLLIVFPGGGSNAAETKQEFEIVERATKEGISVILMNFTGKLWLENEDSKKLASIITSVIELNDINTEKLFLGGMSIGGTHAVTLSDYLIKSHATFQIDGVFIVDSPLDLYALYESSQKDLLRTDFTEERLAEPKFIITFFENEFGTGDSLLSNIQKVSPMTHKGWDTGKFKSLKQQKIRLYTEPDTLWLKETRGTDFESSNAFTIQQTYKLLRKQKYDVELIQTKDKGYRSDGTRNPHSWSIVDVDDLILWMQEPYAN